MPPNTPQLGALLINNDDGNSPYVSGDFMRVKSSKKESDEDEYGRKKDNFASFEVRGEDEVMGSQTQDLAVDMGDCSQANLVMTNSPWRPSGVEDDQTLALSDNQSVDYQLFRAQYVNLRNQFSETFQNKIFAENIVYKGRRMKLTDESTYELVHSNLHALELSDENGNSLIGRNAVLQTTTGGANTTLKQTSAMKTTITQSTMVQTHD